MKINIIKGRECTDKLLSKQACDDCNQLTDKMLRMTVRQAREGVGDPNDCLSVPGQPPCLRYQANYKVPQLSLGSPGTRRAQS